MKINVKNLPRFMLQFVLDRFHSFMSFIFKESIMGRKKSQVVETPEVIDETVEEVIDETVEEVATSRPGRMPLPETQELIDKIIALVSEAGEEGITNIALSQALEIGTLKTSSLATRLVRQGVLEMSKAENGRTSYFLAEASAEA